jgi:flagellar biosynthetic protein FlhB
MSERTEPPTGRKIAEARAEGNVPRSQELNAAAGLLVGAWLLQNSGKLLAQQLKIILTEAASKAPFVDFSGDWLREMILINIQRLLPSLGLILAGMLITGVVVTVSQTGLLWANKKLGFRLDRLNPLAGIKRIFSLNGLIEVVKALLKLFVVGWVAYTFLRDRAAEVVSMGNMSMSDAISFWAELGLSLFMRVGFAYLILAFIDYAYQRWNYNRSMKMTKEEVKEDAKRTEGDPLIRGRIRAKQRQVARMRMMANVHKADVVITNPTHLAIAVSYKADEMNAPKVLAKGAFLVAERIVSLARIHQIPVVQNIPVARALYRSVEVDQEIPPELYTALAEVLAYVYRMRGKRRAVPVQVEQ